MMNLWMDSSNVGGEFINATRIPQCRSRGDTVDHVSLRGRFSHSHEIPIDFVLTESEGSAKRHLIHEVLESQHVLVDNQTRPDGLCANGI